MTVRSRKALPLIVAALGIVALLLLWLLAPRRPEAAAPGNGLSVGPRTAVASPEGASPASKPALAESPAPAPELPARPPGRIVGKVLIPSTVEHYSYRLYVYTSKGPEARDSLEGVDRFAFDGLTPGQKAVVLISSSGDLGSVVSPVTVLEGQETEVVLSPPAPTFLEGQVVDATGAEVPYLLIAYKEALPLKDVFGANASPTMTSTGEFGGTTETYKGRHLPTRSFSIDPWTGSLSRRVPTDKHGRFRLSLSSSPAALSVQILLGPGTLLKEESVIPSAGPLRLILPAGVDGEK